MGEETKTFNDFLEEEQTSSDTEEVVEEQGEEIEESDEEELVEEPLEDESEEAAADVDDSSSEDEESVEGDAPEAEEESEEHPDFKAFAEMRVKQKEIQAQKEAAEAEKAKAEQVAKNLGYANLDEMLKASEKRNLEAQAKKEGVPVEFLERLNKLEAENKKAKEMAMKSDKERKEAGVIHTIDSVIESKKLSDKDLATIFNSLEADGFTYEALVEMPQKSVQKLMEAYSPQKVDKQKAIAKKEQLKKEIPLTPDSKETDDVKSAEDELFSYFSGQKRDF